MQYILQIFLKNRCFSRFFGIIRKKTSFISKNLRKSPEISQMLRDASVSSRTTRKKVAAPKMGRESPTAPL